MTIIFRFFWTEQIKKTSIIIQTTKWIDFASDWSGWIQLNHPVVCSRCILLTLMPKLRNSRNRCYGWPGAGAGLWATLGWGPSSPGIETRLDTCPLARHVSSLVTSWRWKTPLSEKRPQSHILSVMISEIKNSCIDISNFYLSFRIDGFGRCGVAVRCGGGHTSKDFLYKGQVNIEKNV